MKSHKRSAGQRVLVFILATAVGSTGFLYAPMAVRGMDSRSGAAAGIEAGQESDTTDSPGTADDPVTPADPTYTDDQGVVYTCSSKSVCYVTGYSQDIESTVEIPAEIKVDGSIYRVKGISEKAFKDCVSLRTLEVPNSVADIGGNAFKDCQKLKQIIIIPDKTQEKRNKKTSVITLKVGGGLLCTEADVKLGIDAELLKAAVSDKKTDSVTVQVLVKDNAAYRVGERTLNDIALRKNAVKSLAGKKKSFKLRVRDAVGGSYAVKAGADELKKLSGDLALAVSRQKVKDTAGELNTDLKKGASLQRFRSIRTRYQRTGRSA